MSHRFAFPIVAALLSTGCGPPFNDPPGRAQANECTSSDECGGDGVCRQSICVATRVDLPGLLVEVRPHAGASYGATTSFFFAPGDKAGIAGSNDSGVSAGFSPMLPAPIAINGAKILPFEAKNGCDTVNAQVTFYERPALERLPINAAIIASTSLDVDGFVLQAQLKPATYDVYVAPIAVDGCDTPPPAFFPDQVIDGAKKDFTWQLPAPSKLTGKILVPIIVPGSVGTWVVDIVDRERGSRVSTTQELTQQALEFSVDVDIDFTWRDGPAPFLRLAPPLDTPGPTVLFSLDAVGGTKDNPIVSLSIQDLLIKPRMVKPLLLHGSNGVTGAVSIQSSKLSGDVAQNASFALDMAATNVDGSLPVELPPGEYTVRVFPEDPALAVTEQPLVVPPLMPGNPADKCVCGLVIQIDDKAVLQSTAHTPMGNPLLTVAVSTVPSQTGPTSFLANQHSLDEQSARTSSTLTNEFGRFLLEVDRGKSDLTVQPAPESGFPWLVRPRLEIKDDIQLGALTLTNPALLSGIVVDPNGDPVANSDVKAWLPLLDANGVTTSTVILIATTSTNDDGSYTLVLPASLTK